MLACDRKILLIIGDLSSAKNGGITAEECARINAAIRYASQNHLPIDWFSASYGVAIQRESGVENLDASAATARELVRHCHGVQCNIIIDDVNVGA